MLGDGLGATHQTTNRSQGIVWASGYTAFGQSVGQSGSTVNHYGWGAGSGYRSDSFGPTGAASVMKVGCRYYDPEFGCFLTRDTVLTEKPYAYCNGDPVNFSDPTGHDPTKRFWVWAGVTALVIAEVIVATGATMAGGGAFAIPAAVLAIGGTIAWAYGGDTGGPFFKGKGGGKEPPEKEPPLPGRRGGDPANAISTSAINQDYRQGDGNNWYPYGQPYSGLPHGDPTPPGAVLH